MAARGRAATERAWCRQGRGRRPPGHPGPYGVHVTAAHDLDRRVQPYDNTERFGRARGRGPASEGRPFSSSSSTFAAASQVLGVIRVPLAGALGTTERPGQLRWRLRATVVDHSVAELGDSQLVAQAEPVLAHGFGIRPGQFNADVDGRPAAHLGRRWLSSPALLMSARGRRRDGGRARRASTRYHRGRPVSAFGTSRLLI